MARREFKKSVAAQIVLRATNKATGQVHCEECGGACKRWEIDHIIADGLTVDKSKPLKAEEGRLLCEPCHAVKTTTHDVPAIAKAKRVEAKHLRLKPVGPQPEIRSAPMMTTPKAAKRAERGHRDSLPPRQLYVDMTETTR